MATLNPRLERLRPPPLTEESGAGAGEGVAALRGQYDILAWADPFSPDGPLPDSVAQAMIDAIRQGIGSHYEPPTGASNLRHALAARVGPRLGRTLDPETNVLVTPGSDSGLYYALSAVLQAGDEVIVPTPSYPSNIQVPRLLGAEPVTVALRPEDEYQMDVDAIAAAITPKTRAIVLTHPNNPTGTVHRADRLRALAELIVEHDLFLVSDQAFEDLVFDNIDMVSPASLPGMWERTLTVHSFSKGYGLSGLRVGYIIGADNSLAPMLAASVLVLGAPNTLAQVGALAALQDDAILERHSAEFLARRTYVAEVLGRVPGVRILPAESGILSWVDVSALGDSAAVARHVRERAGVILNEGDAYGPGGEGHLRVVHGALGDHSKFEAAIDRVGASLRELSQ